MMFRDVWSFWCLWQARTMQTLWSAMACVWSTAINIPHVDTPKHNWAGPSCEQEHQEASFGASGHHLDPFHPWKSSSHMLSDFFHMFLKLVASILVAFASMLSHCRYAASDPTFWGTMKVQSMRHSLPLSARPARWSNLYISCNMLTDPDISWDYRKSMRCIQTISNYYIWKL